MFKREKLRIIGIYLIIILSLFIFILSPLSNSVEDKKTLLNEYLETYGTKAMLMQRKIQINKTLGKSISERERELLASLFPKDSLVSEIQIKTLKAITKSVEKHGLELVNFQFPENAVSKDLGEVSIIVNIRGIPKAIIGLLKEINQMNMITDVKNLKITSKRKQYTVRLTLTNYRIES